ncbi:hypothetical protein PoB_002399000 [Plakobranchus ocellatus]|uniref:Uncharacterized protein n=1 Tax=Plakobranchus ocellatus TaxID=259542 RepID=A0AAV3ZQS3_9GAST|nr:hypothetical protein PoB_002399000 [Plakobranchus ocellatus]
MIRQEVHYLYRVDSDMSVDHCTTKCDALFDLVAANDEHMTDRWCHYECACQKNHTCLSHLRTTTALPPRTTMMRTDVPTTNPPSSVP